MLNRRENIKTCYVCKREIKDDAVYLTEGVYRHSDCYAGSLRWLKSEVGKSSKYYNLFERGE